MNIPDTIVCSVEQEISYIYTNSKGYLEIEIINQDESSQDEEHHHYHHDNNENYKHDTLTDNAIKRLA